VLPPPRRACAITRAKSHKRLAKPDNQHRLLAAGQVRRNIGAGSRGLVRDGEQARHLWLNWMDKERDFFLKDGTRKRADLLVSGGVSDGIINDEDVLTIDEA
jgi:hypothetical protein